MNSTVATDRTAAAVSAARKAGARLGLTFTSARWNGCRSYREAYAGDGAVRMTATRDGSWSLRDRTGALVASGQADR